MNPKPPRAIQKHLAHIKRTQRDHLFYAFVAPYLNKLPTTRTQELKLQYPPEFTMNQIRHQWRKHFEGDFSTAGRFKLSFKPHPNGWILTITRKDFPQPACATVLFSDEAEVPSPTILPTEPYIAPWIKEAEQAAQQATPYEENPFKILDRKGYKASGEAPSLMSKFGQPTGNEAAPPIEEDADCPFDESEQELLNDIESALSDEEAPDA